VAGVDREAEEVLLLGGFFRGEEGAEKGFGCDGCVVGDGDAAAGGVVDGEDTEVLNESTAAPDVENLDAEADGEDGLVEIVGVLEEELIDVLARVVRGGGFGDGFVAVFVGIDVGGATGEENGLAGVNEIGNSGWGSSEGDLDGLAAASFDGRSVLRPGALVIGDVGAGGDGDGDARLHRAGARV
jgi:hypothetical protein